MEGFTILDGIVAVVVVISALLAYSRGFVREMMSILGWIAAAVLAFMFAGRAEPLIKEIPVVGEFLTDSCELSIIAAFAAVFTLALVLVSLFTPIFSSVIQRSVLGGPDHVLGFIFGALRGLLLVAVAFLVYDRVVLDDSVPMVDESSSAQIFARVQASLEAQIPSDVPGWLLERYEELVGDCGPGGGTTSG
ncbi:MAG: CvpA family protein [Pseudomonadota bacterium]